MVWGASLVTSSAALAMDNTTMAPDAGDLPYLPLDLLTVIYCPI